jgi:hypothetical protein
MQRSVMRGFSKPWIPLRFIQATELPKDAKGAATLPRLLYFFSRKERHVSRYVAYQQNFLSRSE